MSLSPPRPLSEKASTGPAAARAAAQDAQIAELVQQNRALEHTLAQLRARLREEEARGADAVNQIRERWKADRKEWREGCESLQERHRLAHLQTRVALEHERGYRIEDRAALITERAATLLREYRITLFQAKETELVAQVAALEEELEAQREEMVVKLARQDSEVAKLVFRLSEAEARRNEHDIEFGAVSQTNQSLDTELAQLRASSDSSEKQIDRLKLQTETLHTQISTLEARNRELEHQVDKWQNLEGRGEREVSYLRTRRIELEVRVTELEMNLKESRAMVKKVAKLESSLLETQEQVEKRQRDVSEAQAEAARAQRHAARLERQVEKLQAQLDAERSQKSVPQNPPKPPQTAGSRAQSVFSDEPQSSNNVNRALPPNPQSRFQTRDPRRAHIATDKGNTNGKGKLIDDPGDILERSTQHGEGGRHETEYRSGNMKAGNDNVVDAEVPPPTRTWDRRQEQDSGSEEVPPTVESRKPPSNAGKTTETDTKGEGTEEWGAKRAISQLTSTASGQKQPEVDTDDEHPAKKKKRKLTVTGGTSVFGGPAGFTWNPNDGGDLGIPSVLSPVKEGEPVPARSMSASGWKMR